MATLWRQHTDERARWHAYPLHRAHEAFAGLAGRAAATTIAPFGNGGAAGVALLVPQNVAGWVNGEPIAGGLKALAHRDEILVGGCLYQYSAQSRPVISRFALPDGERRPRCAVCRIDIDDGQAVVACPQCGRVYHEADEDGERAAKKCWTYRPTCLCGHPTGLGAYDAWRPDMEGDDE